MTMSSPLTPLSQDIQRNAGRWAAVQMVGRNSSVIERLFASSLHSSQKENSSSNIIIQHTILLNLHCSSAIIKSHSFGTLFLPLIYSRLRRQTSLFYRFIGTIRSHNATSQIYFAKSTNVHSHTIKHRSSKYYFKFSLLVPLLLKIKITAFILIHITLYFTFTPAVAEYPFFYL